MYFLTLSHTVHVTACGVFCSTGAQIVGVNCHFDPMTCVETVKQMKEGVEKAGLKAHYMVQPLAYHTPDCNCQGFINLPEFPFGNEILSCIINLPFQLFWIRTVLIYALCW